MLKSKTSDIESLQEACEAQKNEWEALQKQYHSVLKYSDSITAENISLKADNTKNVSQVIILDETFFKI